MLICVLEFMVSEWHKAEFIWASGPSDALGSLDFLLRSVFVSQIDARRRLYIGCVAQHACTYVLVKFMVSK